MSNLPARVQIGPYSYGVERGKRHMKGSFASIRHPALEIRLKPGLARSHERESLMHEILHGIIYASGHAMRNVDNNEMHESLVHTLSPAILDTLRRNPELVAYLLAEEAD